MSSVTARNSLLAIIDQSVVSGTNFIIGAFLARFCSPEEFGSYVLAFSILLFLNGFQSSLITVPMMTLGAPKYGEEAKSYFSTLLVAQSIIGIILALLIIISQLFVGFLNDISESFRNSLLGLGVAILAMQSQDFFRRALLTKGLVSRTLSNDLASYGSQILGVILLWKSGAGEVHSQIPGLLSARNVFLLFAVTSLIGSILGYMQGRHYFTTKIIDFKKYLKENWDFGKWGLLSMLGGVASIQASTWIIGALGGRNAVATVEAPRLIVAPIQVLIFGLGNALIPRAALVYEYFGCKGLRKFLRKTGAMWLIITLLFGVILFFCGHSILDLIFGGKYLDMENFFIWTLIYVVMGLRQVPGYGISAIKRPDIGVKISLFVGFITLFLTALFMRYGGVTYALVARLIGEIVTMVLLIYFFLFSFKKLCNCNSF